MKKTRATRSAGFTSVDFLFSMVLGSGLVLLLVALTSTLSIIQVAQYMAFSTARAHAAGHETLAQQKDLGTQKFKSFFDRSKNPVLSNLLSNEWFKIDSNSLDLRSGADGKDFNAEYGVDESKKALPNIGVRFQISAPVLEFKIPFVGSTARDQGYKSFITGFIFREPSSEECRLQMKARYDAIIRLDSRFGRIATESDVKPSSYMPMEDNGC